MTEAHEPIAEPDADDIFASLARFDALLLAVSGGPDSLALLHLIAEWRRRLGGQAPKVCVATVDHGLRAESALEAAAVADQCAGLGLDHATLVWTGPKPKRGVPDAARRARYALLEAHAATLQPGRSMAVVTAHTQDDQAETLVMRLARGAGVDGLAAIVPERPLSPGSGIVLVRPLLGISKARLVASLIERGVTWCEDPTNFDAAFERVRVRGVLASLQDAGVERAALAATARRMGDARAALDFAALAFKETLQLSFNSEVFAAFDRQAFERGPGLLRQRVIEGLIRRFGGTSPAPELSGIEALIAHMAAKPKSSATLGGTVVSSGERWIRIWREAGRLTAADLTLVPGVPQLWDKRFWVMVSEPCSVPVRVKALGRAGYSGISARVIPGHRPPANAAHALPAFWSGAGLLGVPTLALYDLPRGSEGHLNPGCPATSLRAKPVHAP